MKLISNLIVVMVETFQEDILPPYFDFAITRSLIHVWTASCIVASFRDSKPNAYCVIFIYNVYIIARRFMINLLFFCFINYFFSFVSTSPFASDEDH